MTTIAQEAFQTFKEKQLKIDYDWDNLDQDLEMKEYTKLKISALKEIDSNRKEEEATALLQQEKALQILNQAILGKGFKNDGSEADWTLLFNRPAIFGANWRTLVDKHKDSGIERFQGYFQRFYKVL